MLKNSAYKQISVDSTLFNRCEWSDSRSGRHNVQIHRMAIFWKVTPCSWVEAYQPFGATCCVIYISKIYELRNLSRLQGVTPPDDRNVDRSTHHSRHLNSYVLRHSVDGAFQSIMFILGGILSCFVREYCIASSGRAEASLFHTHKGFLQWIPF